MTEGDRLKIWKTHIGANLPIYVVEKIDDFRKRHKLKDRTSAIVQLVETALYVENKMGLAESWNSEDLEEIKHQLETGQLVDWVATLERDKFNAIVNIIRTEQDIRNGQRRII